MIILLYIGVILCITKDQILDELSSEHEAVSSHKELKVEEGNKMEFSEKPKGEERHLSEIQSEGQSLEEVQLLGGEGEQQRIHSNPVDDEQPKKDNIAQQLETTGTGVLSFLYTPVHYMCYVYNR